MLLKEKTAVITGCNRGIGKKILEVFSTNGANIFACVRTNDENFKKFVQNKMSENKNQITIIEFDLDKENEVKEGARKILDHNIPINIIISNAGKIST